MAIDAGIAPKSENLPVQVTPIRLTKDNYLSWSAALEIGITSRGRLPYITGDKPAPSKTDPQWANWALEDSKVKVWIISSVSADIQPLISWKPTSFEMWNVLARMYGRKKRVLRTYQIKRSIYALKQGDLSVASYYATLKTKWGELDYHVEDNWDCGSDHARHWEMEWMDCTFLFLGGLRDEFETIRSQILNCDDIPGIEDVYARVESEEQRRQVMQIDPNRGSGPSAFVSRSSVPSQRPARRCTHCHKLGHSADFCWDLHPEKRLVRGRPPPSRRGPLVQESNQGLRFAPRLELLCGFSPLHEENVPIHFAFTSNACMAEDFKGKSFKVGSGPRPGPAAYPRESPTRAVLPRPHLALPLFVAVLAAREIHAEKKKKQKEEVPAATTAAATAAAEVATAAAWRLGSVGGGGTTRLVSLKLIERLKGAVGGVTAVWTLGLGYTGHVASTLSSKLEEFCERATDERPVGCGYVFGRRPAFATGLACSECRRCKAPGYCCVLSWSVGLPPSQPRCPREG
ncbi:hypothetical protein EJ110_NYTH11159 [Nymphaea thermarum]|nr:hypothetical protein EJ110_NYTH11159 [Nymphaea thermarum]